jgi:hypothetical protein
MATADAEVAYRLRREKLNIPPLVGVIQGKGLRECMILAEFYANEPIFEGIAIPRCLTPIFGSRQRIAVEIHERWPDRFKLWHLLGFSDNIMDDFATAKLPWIDGIDSAVPIRGGIQERPFTLPDYDVGPRGQYWNTAFLRSKQSEIISSNIAAVEHFIA